MDKKLTKRLNEERARRLSEAAKLLENDDIDGAKSQLNWVDTSSKLLSSTQHATRRKWSVIILSVCVVLAGIAWTLRISRTHVSLDVITENVVLTLRQDWSCNHHFTPGRILISNITELSAPGLNLTAGANSGKDSMWLELQGNGISVEELTLLAGANVELSLKDHEFQLFVKESPLAGELLVRHAEITVETEDDTETLSVDSEIPETITFKTAKTGAAPVQLTLVGQEDWRLRGLHTQALGFVEEYPVGSGNFESVIRSGMITIQETGVTEELLETEYLGLGNPKSRRLELSKTDNGVNVLFEGTAAKIIAGPQDFTNDLTPTYFEYIYHQQKLKVFWGAVLFLSGLLWRIRDTIFKS